MAVLTNLLFERWTRLGRHPIRVLRLLQQVSIAHRIRSCVHRRSQVHFRVGVVVGLDLGPLLHLVQSLHPELGIRIRRTRRLLWHSSSSSRMASGIVIHCHGLEASNAIEEVVVALSH